MLNTPAMVNLDSALQTDPTFPYEQSFARVAAVAGHTVSLQFDLEQTCWPWLMLPAQHPVLVEKYQFFGSVIGARAVKALPANQYAALTRYQWQCPVATSEPASRAECSFQVEGPQTMHFKMDFWNASGDHVIAMRGSGFSFSDRDFKSWRQRSRSAVIAVVGTDAIELAMPSLLGLIPGAAPFVSAPLLRGDALHLIAQVSRSHGFHPQHVFHTGSGDHVNAAQLLDCALQAAHRLRARELGDVASPALQVLGAQLRFHRYVELDAPFEIRNEHCEQQPADTKSFCFSVHQAGRHNTDILLRCAEQR